MNKYNYEYIHLIFGDDGELSSGAESVGAVMHDGTIIVGESVGVCVLLNVEIELNARIRMSILT